MIKLRGHHLICLNYYDGDGIDERFKENVQFIKKKMAEGDTVKVVEGPDDVCGECKYLKDYTCHYSLSSEDEVKSLDNLALKHLKFAAGDSVCFSDLKKNLSLISLEFYKEFCSGCNFEGYCKNPLKN
ncbi:DUF1284 domain-containing protein [Thermovenabulum sp.]|uniref:DUF1284 domain-containing protein n=1 Tax=Thermovenabulum sp. TaxID=3100335 RepID=UPI003C7CE98B